jgi:hypothetical protein
MIAEDAREPKPWRACLSSQVCRTPGRKLTPRGVSEFERRVSRLVFPRQVRLRYQGD